MLIITYWSTFDSKVVENSKVADNLLVVGKVVSFGDLVVIN